MQTFIGIKAPEGLSRLHRSSPAAAPVCGIRASPQPGARPEAWGDMASKGRRCKARCDARCHPGIAGSPGDVSASPAAYSGSCTREGRGAQGGAATCPEDIPCAEGTQGSTATEKSTQISQDRCIPDLLQLAPTACSTLRRQRTHSGAHVPSPLGDLEAHGMLTMAT